MAARLKGGLRVHVAPVGYYLDRVWEVPLKNKADRLWLIVDEEGAKSNEAPYRDEIKRHIGKRIDVREEPAKLWDLKDLLRAYVKVVREELAENNEVWLNISTGSKLQGVAGALTAMSHGTHAYYVVAEDFEKPPKRPGVRGPVPLASGVKAVVPLPVYRLDRPPPEEVEVLRALQAMGGKTVKKKELVKKLLAEGWESEVESKRRDKSQAALMRLNRLLEGLERAPEKVEQIGNTRRRRISLTEEGALLLTLLG